MLDDTQSSMAIYPSNKTISIGDKNVSGINIATQGANFSTNTIKIGTANSTVNVGGNVTMKYGDCSITAKSLQAGYNTTGYTEGSEYSVSIWGLSDNNYNSFTIGIPIQLSAYTTYRMTITCRTNQTSMTVFIQNPAWNVIYDSLAVTNTFQTFVFTFTNGSSESTPLFYITTNNTVSAGKSFIWNYVKLETVCVGIGNTNPAYMLDVTGTTRLGAWGFNTTSEKFFKALGTQLPVTHTNYALFQSNDETRLNHPLVNHIAINNGNIIRIDNTNIIHYRPNVINGNNNDVLTLKPPTAYSQRSNIAMYASFPNTVQDVQHTADIYSGITSYDWDTPYLGFGVGYTASNTERIQTTERMRITALGRVGIGTTAPAYMLDVIGDTHCSGSLYVGTNNDPSTGNTLAEREGGCIFLGGTYHDNGWDNALIKTRRYSKAASWENSEMLLFKGYDLASGDNGADRIRLRSANILFDTYPAASSDPNAENIRMLIDSTGRVGIGTTAPAFTLDVSGSARITSPTNEGLKIAPYDVAGTTSQRGNIAMYASFQNNGDQDPRRACDIYAGYTSVWGGEYMAFGVGVDLIRNENPYNVGTVERMRITQAGRVGIGTTNPIVGLEVRNDTACIWIRKSATNTNDVSVLGFNYGGGGSGDIGSNNTFPETPTEALPGGTMFGARIKAVAPYTYGTQSDLYFQHKANFAYGGNINDNKYITSMVLKATGNVGIGTTTPAYLLHVNGTAGIHGNNNDVLILKPPSGVLGQRSNIAMYGSFSVGSDGTAYRVGDIFCGAVAQDWSSGYMAFGVGATPIGSTGVAMSPTVQSLERMRITGQGNVGIGTTDPGTYKLSVNGDVKIGAWYTNLGYLGTHSPPISNNFALYQDVNCTVLNSATQLRLNIGDAQKMTILSNGDVGIGTTTPAYRLDVNGTARISSTSQSHIGNWKFENNYFGTNPGGTDFALYQFGGDTVLNTTGTISFKKSNATTMTIDGMGRLGIGTTAPGFNLDVVGTVHCSGALYVGNNGDGGNNQTGGGEINFGGTYGDNDYTHSRIIARKYGTGEESELLIYKGNDGSDRIRLKAYTIQFDTGSTSNILTDENIRMTIYSNGNVGIGTTSPAYLLHVNGTAQISNYVISSDQRIKTSIETVDTSQALTLFRKLQPKTYHYKDDFKNKKKTYGFVAQDVDEVFPLAVDKSTGTVPNIYDTCLVSQDKITIDVSKLEYDASGQLFTKLKITKDSAEVFVQILKVIDSNTIQIDTTLSGDSVFVYGQEVDNFHVLENDMIWTVASSALQEVDKQLQGVDRQLQGEKENTKTLQTEVENLKQENQVIQQNYGSLQQNYGSLQQNYVSLQQNYVSLLARIIALESK